MKKAILVLSLILCIFSFTGCNFQDGTPSRLLKRVEDIPEGWSDSEVSAYYYEVDTKIVYFGSCDLRTGYGVYLNELKSKDYVNYIYDEEKNEFIGIER